MFGWIFHPKDFSAKGFLRRQNNGISYKLIVIARMILLTDKLDKHKIQELREMIEQRAPDQPVEKVLAIFCERHALSPETCMYYYNLLVKEGVIKEK